MDEFNRLSPMPPVREVVRDVNPDVKSESLPDAPANAHTDVPAGGATPAPQVMPSDAVAKFQSCRWRCDPDAGAFCTHRDVLPFAGKEGFVADSWCPDCGFYKLRRTPKKRDYNSY
jgi:hypothetical protein